MKLLLIQPPIQDFYETSIRLQPIGLCYLKAIIKKHLPNIKTTIKDYHHGYKRRTIPIPKELSYLKEYYTFDQSPFSMFHNYYHFGADFQDIANEVEKENYDMIGISSLFSPYSREVLQTAQAIKEKIDIPIIAGGAHISSCPEALLESPYIDYIIVGEGEKPMVEFLSAFHEKKNLEQISNLGYKRHGKIIINASQSNYPLESLPFPDLSDFTIDSYLFEKKPLCSIISSRSCPHKCAFCSVHLTFGKQFRFRSSQNILEEMKLRYSQGYRVFDFEDDNLTFKINNFKNLCQSIINTFPKDTIQLTAMNGISYQSLDEETLFLMKKAGFTHLNISIVSRNMQIKNKYSRPHSNKKYLAVIKTAKAIDLKITSYQIVGLPEESLDSIIDTFLLNIHQPVLMGTSLFYLTPGSPISQIFPPQQEEDIMKSRLTAMAIETSSVKRNDLYTIFITSRIINFIKGISLSQKECSLNEALEIAQNNGKRAQIGTELLKRLLNEKVLYVQTQSQLKKLTHFKADLFDKIWKQIKFITTQEDRKIYLQ